MPEWYGGSALKPDALIPAARQWEPQWHRVDRWYQRAMRHRVKSTTTPLDPADLDDLLAYFLNCFQLRDWLKAARPDLSSSVVSLFNRNLELRLCRDIANGFKHKHLERPSHDRDFNFFREYDHFSTGSNPVHYYLTFDVRGKLLKFDVFDLIERCHELCSSLVAHLEASNR
jgi:hypothetical protein